MRRPFPLTAPVLALALTGVLALAGCGTHSDDDARAAEARPTTWPLTGLPAGSGDKGGEKGGGAEKRRPVLVVKMDNTASSAPQRGLSKADLVVEELVEGGLTRLAAFYYSQLPDLVGPVRSMRASDIGIVSPVGASVVTSGAAAVTIRRIRGAGIAFYGEGTPGFFRDSGRYAPYNLMAHLPEVATEARTKVAARPDDYLPFGDRQPDGGPRARTLSASFGSGHTTTWTYRGKRYVNTDSYAAPDERFDADTVLVLRVRVGDAGYKDPAGYPVPETMLTGTGKALLFHGGRLVRGTWSKQGLDAALTLSTADGPLDVPPGRTWIELVPAANGDVSFE